MRAFTAKALEAIGCLESPNPVMEAIRSRPLPEFDYDSIVDLVILACDLYLEDDLKADFLLVEREWDSGASKGVFDLVKVMGPKTRVIDWKTTGDASKPNLGDELKEEFQSSFYLSQGGQDLVSKEALPPPERIEYRVLDAKEEVKQLVGGPVLVKTHAKLFTKDWTPSTEDDALSQLEAASALYASQLGLQVWARNRPRACFKGGGQARGPSCPFWDDCTAMTMPRGTALTQVELWDKRPRSKSAVKDFMECPERFRRTRLMGLEGEALTSRAILMGEAFHEAVAVVWQRAWDLRHQLLAS